MASGDLCWFGRDPMTGKTNGTVVHQDCDDYADGIVTEIATGKIIAKISADGKVTRF